MSQITKSPFSDSKAFGFSHYNDNTHDELSHRLLDRKDPNKKGVEADLRAANSFLLEGKSPLKDTAHNLFMNKLHMHSKGGAEDYSEKGLMSTSKDPIKPAESPFTLFCKELRLSPAPLHFASPSPFGYGFPFKSRPEMMQFASPSPVPMRHFNEFDSPFQPRKNPARLNFEFMFQGNQEDHNIETEQNTKNDDMAGRAQGSKSPFSPKFSQMKKSVYTLNGAPSYNAFPKGQTQTPDTKFSDHDSEKQIAQETADGGHEDRAMKVESEGYYEDERPSKSNRHHHHHSDMEENHHLAQRKSSITSNNHSQGFGEDGIYHEDHQHSGQKGQAKICCNCKKSRCLKLYCDCFARGEYCKGDCNCVQCLNTKATEKERQQAMASITEKNPNAFKPKVDLGMGAEIKTGDKGRHSIGCHCKKSGCQKKYCECYQAGVECSEYCRCENCKNTSNSSCNHKKPKKGGSLGLKSDNSSKSHSGSKENHRSNNRSSDYENIYEDDEEISAYSQPVKKLHTENIRPAFDVKNNGNSKDFEIPKLVLPGGGTAMEFENDGQYMKKYGSHEKHSKRTRALHTSQHSYHK